MPQEESELEFAYSPHELRLNLTEWVAVLTIVLLFVLLAPWSWSRRESIGNRDQDYRVPYELSNDYWLYQKHLESQTGLAKGKRPVYVIGDSVIWGEYVKRDGTLSHFLNTESPAVWQRTLRFVNAGVNGLFPLALEGLIRDHGQVVRDSHVILHFNILWMTSPEADLSVEKEHKFNHEALVPQFGVRIACYRADFEKRLGYWLDRKIPLFAWTRHLEDVYFDQLNIPEWTLEEGNEWRNPFSAVSLEVPGEAANDLERGEDSERHRSWNERGMKPQNFPWLKGKSLQFDAFERLVNVLESRGNEVLIVFGPFNEHMIAPDSREKYGEMRNGAMLWFGKMQVDVFQPSLLPAELYGDSSHPLTEGYRQMARELRENKDFRNWLDLK